MKMKNFAEGEIAQVIASLTPEKASKIAQAVIESCAKSENHSAEFTIQNKMDRTDGLPCLVSIQGPFGICICVLPPGASC